MTIDDDIIVPILVAFFAIIIVIGNQTFVPISAYEQDTNELADKIHALYEANDKLQYQVDHPPSLENLKLQLKLVEDGASIEEAKLIIEQSTEAGLSPKL